MTMTMTTMVDLGPPGIRVLPEPAPPPTAAVRMDVPVFAGIAARGPAWCAPPDHPDPAVIGLTERVRTVPVPVHSWTDFVEVFGGHDAPGLLSRAVAAFFAQGGRQAQILRIVPALPTPAMHGTVPGCAGFDLATLRVRARNEGSWGNSLRVRMAVEAASVAAPEPAGAPLGPDWTVPAAAAQWPAGTAVRSTDAAGHRRVHRVQESTPLAHGRGWRVAVRLLPALPLALVGVEILTATIIIDDGAGRTERFTGLAFDAEHPDWIARVLAASSRLVDVDPGGPDHLDPVPVEAVPASPLTGTDRYEQLTPEDFLADAEFLPDPELPPAGVGAAALADDATLLIAPDLYHPDDADIDPPPPEVTPEVGPAEFGLCGPPAPPLLPVSPASLLPGLLLDPRADLDAIAMLQQRLIDAAAKLDLLALVDVPPQLTPAAVRRWRSNFDSTYAAGYLGWPRVPDPVTGVLHAVPPSAVAAGVVATTWLTSGPGRGPAQQPVNGAVAVLDGPGRIVPGDAALQGEWHRLGLNVTNAGPRFVHQSAARLLSSDAGFRQLTTRRVLQYLRRRIAVDLAFTVFEPLGPVLRTAVRLTVEHLLDELQQAGAFAGANRGASTSLRMPSGPNESSLLCEIGVDVAEPLEYLLIRLVRADDGSIDLDPVSVGGAR